MSVSKKLLIVIAAIACCSCLITANSEHRRNYGLYDNSSPLNPRFNYGYGSYSPSYYYDPRYFGYGYYRQQASPYPYGATPFAYQHGIGKRSAEPSHTFHGNEALLNPYQAYGQQYVGRVPFGPGVATHPNGEKSYVEQHGIGKRSAEPSYIFYGNRALLDPYQPYGEQYVGRVPYGPGVATHPNGAKSYVEQHGVGKRSAEPNNYSYGGVAFPYRNQYNGQYSNPSYWNPSSYSYSTFQRYSRSADPQS